MNLRLGYDSRTNHYFIQLNQSSTGKMSTVFTPTVTGISNFINVMKAYEKITISFDSSLNVTQKQSIRDDIENNVTLP